MTDVDYEYITEQSALLKIIPTIMEKRNKAWGLDTETTGLDPHVDKVTLMQIGKHDKQFVIDTRKVNVEPLRPFLESREKKKILHHAKFDYLMIKGTFGIDVENMRDTMIAEDVLNKGRKKRGFSLDAILGDRMGIEVNKELQKSFIGHIGDFSEDQLAYAARDVVYLNSLASEQIGEMVTVNLINTWLLECAAVPCFGDMEFEGLLLDKEKWQHNIDKHQGLADEIAGEMRALITQIYAAHVPEKREGELLAAEPYDAKTVEFASPKQMLQIFQTMRIKEEVYNRKIRKMEKIPITATGDKILKGIKGVPLIDKLKLWRGYTKRTSTYGHSYLEAIHKNTGKIHPGVRQLGTETGRPSSDKRSISMLTIPKDNNYRNAFIAEDGWVIETDDYSGCELRIWAEISGDPSLRQPLIDGVDLHCHVATKLYGVEVTKTNENAKYRQPAKSLNFGIAYGMGIGRLHIEMNGAGFPMPYAEARRLFNKYGDEFSVGVNYLRDAGRQASKTGFLANLNGRRRYWLLPDPQDRDKYPQGYKDPRYNADLGNIRRKGGNFLIQSVNADMTKLALVNIRNHIKENKVRSKIINQVYDEIVTTTHKDDSPDFVIVKRKIMVEAAEKWLKEVPMGVDGHVGPCWNK